MSGFLPRFSLKKALLLVELIYCLQITISVSVLTIRLYSLFFANLFYYSTYFFYYL